jgi:beta-glucosidase/6-phospho-beta-glucosidase/beta-galactosidase
VRGREEIVQDEFTSISWLRDPKTYFVWASGVEDSFVPQTRGGYRALDEYDLMGHYDHWREDLALAPRMGMSSLRWGIPWYRVEPSPGEYDWSWTDQVIPYITDELGLLLILDLMHYGCPDWLKGGFASPQYPEAVATYAAAVARRYGRWVRWYTPLNEPLMTAHMCGRQGVWPPYLRGHGGYLRLTLQLADGIQRTVEAIRQVQPEAVMVHVEATGLARTRHAALSDLRADEEARNFLGLDLLTGKVTDTHRLAGWVLHHGISWRQIESIQRRAITLDVLGLNFYPQWSTTELYLNRRGKLGFRATEQDGSAFREMIETYAARYHAPIAITETSADGSDEIRSMWLRSSLKTIKTLRAEGVPVIGYTWFPMFTMVDWRYRYGKGPKEQYHIELGAFRLSRSGDPRWEPTPLADELARAAADTLGSVGHLNTQSVAELTAS